MFPFFKNRNPLRSVGERVSGSGDQDVSDQNDQFGMLAPQAATACMFVWLTRTS